MKIFQVAECQNGGRVSGALSTCECPRDFTGQFCEIPVCTRNGNNPDNSLEKRTFVLMADSTQNGAYNSLWTSFSQVLGGVLTAQSQTFPTWFGNFVGVAFKVFVFV